MLPTNTLIENKTILIVDDDMTLCQSLEIGLSAKGAKILIANDGESGIQQFYANRPDLVIMDIRMPGLDGWETSRMMRLVSNTPIIILSSVNKDHEIVRGLRLGADDYVTKPFSYEILMARIETVLRRFEGGKQEQVTAIYDDGHLRIDLQTRNVYTNGAPVKMTSTEFRLLEYLLENAGKRLSYEAILSACWGLGEDNSMTYVHVYISRLRNKIEKDPKEPRYFVTEYGYGYSFRKQAIALG